MPRVNALLKLNTQMVGDKYLVEIEDNGCGISKRNLASIFNTGFTKKPVGLGFRSAHNKGYF
jgi:C4-dicarboxylate-specific signal transduction histidine kinase